MQENKNQIKTWYAISLAFQLGFLVVVSIGGFILWGILGDKYLHTSPFYLLLAL